VREICDRGEREKKYERKKLKWGIYRRYKEIKERAEEEEKYTREIYKRE